ncbi:JAB domain-containing protein [Acidithiobacillus sulfuriphilus]|uniref:JAB domain-containing protein n=1 Tax=Acidithiobacillus sulfuriphilus TaxID=1867749 RepID=UPI003F631AFD
MKNVQTLNNEALLCHLVDRQTARILSRKPLAEVFGYTRPRQGDLNEDPGTYSMPAALAAAKELFTCCLAERLANEDDLAIESPATARALVCGRLAHMEREVFAALWLDNRHRVLAFQELAHGTIDSANVHAREVVGTPAMREVNERMLVKYCRELCDRYETDSTETAP